MVNNKKITSYKIYPDISDKKNNFPLYFYDQIYLVKGSSDKNNKNIFVKKYVFFKDNIEFGKIEIQDKETVFQQFIKKDAFYILNFNSIIKLSNFKTEPFSYTSKKTLIPKSIKWFNFSNGKLNISTLDGVLYFYDENTLQLELTLATNTNVNTANFDENNNIWVATQNNGLHYYSQSTIKQEVFPDNINSNILSVKITKDQTLFAGTFQGEIVKKRKNNYATFYFNNNCKSDLWIRNFHFFTNKTIIVSQNGLNINFIKNIEIYNSNEQSIHIKSSVKVNDSILVLGSISGIFKYNVQTQKQNMLKAPLVRILSLKKKNEHSFYFTANDGLFEYDLRTNKFNLVFANKNFKNDKIQLFEIIKNNKLWISTYKGNLYQIENGKIIKDFSNNEQIPINIVELLHNKNLLWMASKEGVYILDYKNNSKNNILRITKSDGLISDYINDLEYNNDTIYVATDKGISKIPIKNFTSKFNVVPKIISIKINGKITPNASIFHLKSNQTNIALELSGVDVSGHSKNLEYRLNDDEYTKIDGNFLNLQLKNGINKITIRALDVNNSVHPNKIHVQFNIATPFYKTLWFGILLSIFITSLVLLWINKRRLNKQSLKFEQQLALEKQRNQITADLHDDIGATLSSLQLNSAVANHLIRKDLDNAELMLNKIENQSKDLADKIGDIIWSMKPGKNEFMTLSSRIKNFSNDILGATNCNYSIKIDEEIDKVITDITVRKNLILIAKEAINNCAKYSKANTVTIVISRKENKIEMIIQDDGVGFDTTLQNGNGLQNMKQRAIEIKGKLEIVSDKNVGSKIYLQFPYP